MNREAYRYLVYRKERKMFRSMCFNILAAASDLKTAREIMREASDDQVQEFFQGFAKACGERQEEDEYQNALEVIERHESKETT